MLQKNTRKDIAARLQQAREKAGYASAEDFCQQNKLPVDTYRAHEKGEIPIKSLQALHYCKLLRIPLHRLIIGD